jgi:Tfp pilus assembly protein FimT
MELVVVLAILVIVCGIGVPRFIGVVQNRRVLFAGQKLAADLAMAQARANMGSTTVTVNFSVGTGKYTMPGVTDMNTGNLTYSGDIGANPYYAVITSTTIGSLTSTAGTASISFNGFGAPSNGGVITITAGAATCTVAVDAASGRAVAQ